MEKKHNVVLETSGQTPDINDLIRFIQNNKEEYEFDYGEVDAVFEDPKTGIKYNLVGESHEGGEGEGDQWEVILKLLNEDKTVNSYYRCVGWYQSYHGHELDWGDMERVFPKEYVGVQWVTK